MEKRRLICDTAVKVMARDGYYNTKVQTIADEAGIAVGTIYHYFQSKEEILDSIFLLEFEKRLKFLEDIEKKEGPVLNKIKEFLEFHLKEVVEDRNRTRVIAQEIALFSKHMGKPAKELLEKNWVDLAELIEKGQQKGEIRAFDSYTFSIFIFNSLRGVIYMKQFDEENEEYEELKDGIIEFIINALKK